MENIEALLCAYIEGDLDEAGRAEIEKHLRDNPQHQQLIAQMIATRDLVRALPRVKAPRDVDDSMGQQVERNILLDEAAMAASISPRRPSRWPQALAVAATFLLCAGLAYLVIQVIGPTFKPNNIKEADAQQLGAADKSIDNFGGNREASTQSNLTARADAARAAALAQTSQLNAADTQNIDTVRAELERSGYALALPQQTDNHAASVVMLVSSSNPATTGERVDAFIRSHKDLQWSQVQSAALNSAALNNARRSMDLGNTSASPIQDKLVEKNLPNTAGAPPSAGPEQSNLADLQNVDNRSAAASSRNSSAGISPNPPSAGAPTPSAIGPSTGPALPGPNSNQLASSATLPSGNLQADALNPPLAGPPTASASRAGPTYPIDQQQMASNVSNGFSGTNAMQPVFPMGNSVQQGQTPGEIAAPSTQPISGVYVFKSLTPAQADELRQSLAANQDVQMLQVLSPNASTQPSAADELKNEADDRVALGTKSLNNSASQLSHQNAQINEPRDASENAAKQQIAQQRQVAGGVPSQQTQTNAAGESEATHSSQLVDAVIVIQFAVPRNQAAQMPGVFVGRAEAGQSPAPTAGGSVADGSNTGSPSLGGAGGGGIAGEFRGAGRGARGGAGGRGGGGAGGGFRGAGGNGLGGAGAPGANADSTNAPGAPTPASRPTASPQASTQPAQNGLSATRP